MDIQKISYEIHHNSEDFFFPILLRIRYSGEVVSSESFPTMEEAFQRICEQEQSLEHFTEKEHFER